MKLNVILCVFCLVVACVFTACSQKQGVDRTIDATSTDSFAACREHLDSELNVDQLKVFDTAIQELKLDAMNRGIGSAALREQDMRTAVNGKTVKQAMIAGWSARHSRIERELKEMSERLAHDSPLAERSSGGVPSQTMSNLIQNEQDIIAQLKRQLEETDSTINGFGPSGTP